MSYNVTSYMPNRGKRTTTISKSGVGFNQSFNADWIRCNRLCATDFICLPESQTVGDFVDDGVEVFIADSLQTVPGDDTNTGLTRNDPVATLDRAYQIVTNSAWNDQAIITVVGTSRIDIAQAVAPNVSTYRTPSGEPGAGRYPLLIRGDRNVRGTITTTPIATTGGYTGTTFALSRVSNTGVTTGQVGDILEISVQFASGAVLTKGYMIQNVVGGDVYDVISVEGDLGVSNLLSQTYVQGEIYSTPAGFDLGAVVIFLGGDSLIFKDMNIAQTTATGDFPANLAIIGHALFVSSGVTYESQAHSTEVSFTNVYDSFGGLTADLQSNSGATDYQQTCTDNRFTYSGPALANEDDIPNFQFASKSAQAQGWWFDGTVKVNFRNISVTDSNIIVTTGSIQLLEVSDHAILRPQYIFIMDDFGATLDNYDTVIRCSQYASLDVDSIALALTADSVRDSCVSLGWRTGLRIANTAAGIPAFGNPIGATFAQNVVLGTGTYSAFNAVIDGRTNNITGVANDVNLRTDTVNWAAAPVTSTATDYYTFYELQ